MSENIQNHIADVEKRWPTLQNFFSCYLHEDWPIHDGSPEASVDHAISDYDFESLNSVMREWIDWKQRVAKKTDPRDSLNHGLGVNMLFRIPGHARKFIKMVDEKLEAAIGKSQQDLGRTE